MLILNRTFQPVVLTQEQNAGLILKPEEHNVQIVNEPRLDATFKQFLASVGGTVQCLGWYGCLKYGVAVTLRNFEAVCLGCQHAGMDPA
jgi:hypothetical protein